MILNRDPKDSILRTIFVPPIQISDFNSFPQLCCCISWSCQMSLSVGDISHFNGDCLLLQNTVAQYSMMDVSHFRRLYIAQNSVEQTSELRSVPSFGKNVIWQLCRVMTLPWLTSDEEECWSSHKWFCMPASPSTLKTSHRLTSPSAAMNW